MHSEKDTNSLVLLSQNNVFYVAGYLQISYFLHKRSERSDNLPYPDLATKWEVSIPKANLTFSGLKKNILKKYLIYK